jgi:hypothetical protein
MATNRILQATECLADAIAGVQEAPPNELALITSHPPVIMWDPTNDTIANPRQEMRKSTPLAPQDAPSYPTWIKDNHNNVEHLPPPSSIHQHTRNQFLCPSHAGPTTQSQLRARTAHMINCIIAAKLMPSTINPASAPPAAIGYAFTAHQLTIEN